MIYANPVPAEIATGVFYDRAGQEYLSPEKLEGDYSDVRFQRELRLFRHFCPSGHVLDVGCSSGAFLYQLNKRYPRDYEICGMDVSGPPLDYAAKMGIPIIKGDFLAHPFEKSFDAVTFWAVMEHLFEPQSFLKKAASVLKPGGLCFILVPNMHSLAVRVLGAKYRPRAERAQLLKRTNTYKKSRWMLPVRFCYQMAEAVLGTFFMADNLVIIGRKP
jgi:2-polyprenyl-3-methyl-5-hydroxy-6-metoxy-1,4-benzoquinol methylase